MEESTPKHSKHKRANTATLTPCSSKNSTLVPGLPHHLAHLCLRSAPPSILYSVCHSWRRLIYSPSFPPFFSLYALLISPSNTNTSKSIDFFSLDPMSTTWRQLPSPSPNTPLSLCLLHRHPAFLSRNLSIQSIAVSNHLVLIAATNHHFLPALSHPLVFHPASNSWFIGPPLSTPRRWCAAGSAGGALFVASGVGSRYQGDVARSMEKWDLEKKSSDWKWEKMAGLKDGRFSREAVEAVGYRGKLCMVNVKGNAAKEGAVYDIEMNCWEKMPRGMLSGWKGPAATSDEEAMYVVDEANGALSKYDAEKDCWEKVIEESAELKGAEQIAVGRGRVCIISGNGEAIAVVDVVARPARIYVVKPPPTYQAVAVHILPRMTYPDS